MANIALTILSIFFIFWMYTLISIINSPFKHEKVKTFWIIGVIFVPFLVFFYYIKRKEILK